MGQNVAVAEVVHTFKLEYVFFQARTHQASSQRELKEPSARCSACFSQEDQLFCQRWDDAELRALCENQTFDSSSSLSEPVACVVSGQ